ncbi:DinB family protein [Isoptericola sp. b441]|uniref:DinB family protein n=1 Tax=Actinotalea lenta TaxID=3064654 RepID=A0ABT9D610_9CELL|nr:MULTISPECIES: DinB family protein [unclassified Isoptericola]MDO8106260.1 DinB family protein [Isoptericola sp. b441]MDO8122020.1 DinB family protein [Isoptericola sp. b490]
MSEIVPDTKDWTWVLERPCGECGFVAAGLAAPGIAGAVAASVPRWQAVLDRADVRRRPRPDVWSPLEYACHVRDVYRLFAARARLMLDRDGPTFENWDQDATALEERYGEQEPAVVSTELAAAGTEAARVFAAVPADAWQRVGLRSNGSHFTVETLGQYFVHDVVHHLHDVDG